VSRDVARFFDDLATGAHDRTAGALFAVGLLASATVALSVLMATTAYMTGGQMQWRRGLSLRPSEGPLFYGALITAALLGAGIALSGISPVRLLFIAGIVGGIGTPIGLVLLVGVAGNQVLMRGQPVSRLLRVAGWVVTAVVAVSSLGFIVQPFAASL
jgi:Mn2+/Fe2+ NRAMP family transporter